MTTQAFFDKWNGRYIDFDKKFGNQCVDEIRQYCVEVLGINGYTLPAVSYAKQLFTNFPNSGTKNFTKVFNSPTNAPRTGDIVIWGVYLGVTGWAGHVTICSSSNVANLITFDQNYPTNSPCHYQKHSYKGVLGWLTPKK